MELKTKACGIALAALAALITLPAWAVDFSAGQTLATDFLTFITGPFALTVGAIALGFAAYKGFFARDRQIPIWEMVIVLISFIVVRNAEAIMASIGTAA